jgi:hypothetical protein
MHAQKIRLAKPLAKQKVGASSLFTVTRLRERPDNLSLAGSQFVTDLTNEAHRLSLSTYRHSIRRGLHSQYRGSGSSMNEANVADVADIFMRPHGRLVKGRNAYA